MSRALVVSFEMVMRNEFSDRIPQRVFTKENRALETTFFDPANETFCIRVQIWRPRRQFDRLALIQTHQDLSLKIGEDLTSDPGPELMQIRAACLVDFGRKFQESLKIVGAHRAPLQLLSPTCVGGL